MKNDCNVSGDLVNLYSMSKKVVLFIASALFLFSSLLSYSYFSGSSIVAIFSNSSAAPEDSNTPPDQQPKTEECPINGEMLTKQQRNAWEKRRPLGVMIENHTEARPQSGLTDADHVYEIVAEGGITRFLAVYYCKDAETIGPVRSARIYFIKILQGYGVNPLYAHVGGANTPGPADALGEIGDLGWDGYNDLNQFAVPFPNYYRDYDRLPNRATEHTMYSSTEKLWKYAEKSRRLGVKDEDGKAWDGEWKSWKFTDEATATKRGAVKKIDIGYWSRNDADNYTVSWTYDPTTNTYARINGGVPHLDKNTEKQMTTKNVVVLKASESDANDGYEGGHLLYDVVGSGSGVVFMNGQSVDIKWEKETEEDMFVFRTKAGDEIEFVRGQVFVHVIPLEGKLKF